MTIYCMENTLLTQRPNVPGLAVFVKYEDMTPIENLWRICYMLKNTGNQNIVGEGIQSSLVTKRAWTSFVYEKYKTDYSNIRYRQ